MRLLRARTSTYAITTLLGAFTLWAFISLPRHIGRTFSINPWDEARLDFEKLAYKDHTAETFEGKDSPPIAAPLVGATSKVGSSFEPQDQEDDAKYEPPTGASIDDLIKDAEKRFNDLEHKQTFSISDAAEAYRQRRGMHPPPGWDLWFEYARDNNAIIVEEFWDQIYHDLNPFWAISPARIRAEARALEMAIVIKGGKIVDRPDWFWHKIWSKMIETVVDRLPDMLVALNALDESRLLVEREEMDKYMAESIKSRKLVDPEHVVRNVSGWRVEDEQDASPVPDIQWSESNVYHFARKACGEDSLVRKFSGMLGAEKAMAEHERDHEHSKSWLDLKQYFDGKFVVNYTQATDFCSDATIGGLHGALMNPFTTRVSDRLLPMFGGSKFHVNNEILLPAPMYWDGEGRYGDRGRDQDVIYWRTKQDKVIWRGTATGGLTKPYTWFFYHRHRFVALTNGTKYSQASETNDLVFTSFFRKSALTQLKQTTRAHLGDWLKSTHDVGFTHLVCDEVEPRHTCWYLDNEFERVGHVDFSSHWKYKYLPDVDGNSFSGRFRAFLLSNSLPIKATIYREWHDSRLIPWLHFVPMNNRFSDYYAILEYFIGTHDTPGHDAAAEKIATAGKKWSQRVLRKVDMQIYVLRLLLEYARVTDNDRVNLGWVDDILT